MKKIILLVLPVLLGNFGWGQDSGDLAREIDMLKGIIKEMQENELQSDKAKYERDHLLILNGIEIIKEIHQGTIEISNARSQNLLYKKLMDVNNPSSEVLGFQLLDVINQTMEDNINLLPIMDHEKKRLKGNVTNLFEGLKNTFPPLQMIASVVSTISSFTTINPRIEKIGRKADSLIVDVTNPISSSIIKKINEQLMPYIEFYTALNRNNSMFENALYQHAVEYRAYMEEVESIKNMLEQRLDLSQSIGNQVNGLFDISNSSSADFNFKEKLNNDAIKDLLGNCVSIYDLVDRFKKFSNDFLTIQDDFYKTNIAILEEKAMLLPVKDENRINRLIADLQSFKNGSGGVAGGYDASNKMRLKSILAKVHVLNRLRI